MPETTEKYIVLRSRAGGSSATGEWYVDPSLRAHLIRDAEATSSNVRDVALRVLCNRFDVEPPLAGRKGGGGAPDPEADHLHLSMPQALVLKLEIERLGSGGTFQDVVRRALCEHYGLRTPPPPRRGRRPRV